MLLIPRTLAALVDFLLIFSLLMLFGKFLPQPDLQWQLTFVVGAIYFSLCHSKFIGGSTLGKRAFGLRVVDLKSNGPLCLGQAFFRYFFTYGLIIFLAEIPRLYFRNHRIEAEPQTLELHMLLAMFYTMLLVFSALITKSKRGVHDRFSGSAVLRQDETLGTVEDDSPALLQMLASIMLAGFLSYFLWERGIPTNNVESLISSKRYVMEADLSVRFLRIQIVNRELQIDMLITDQNTAEEKTAEVVAAIKKFIFSAPFTKVHFQAQQISSMKPEWKTLDVPF